MREFRNHGSGSYFSLQSSAMFFECSKEKHLEYFAIVINLKQEQQLEIDDYQVGLGENQFISLSPGAHVSLLNEASQSCYWVLFNKQFYCVETFENETSCNGLLFNSAVQGPPIHLDFGQFRRFDLLVNIIKEEIVHNDGVQGEMLKALLKRLIILCVRLNRIHMEKNHKLHQHQLEIFRKFNALVEVHFRSWHTMANYSQAMGVELKALRQVFQKLGDLSPEEVLAYRLEKEAVKELKYSCKDIQDIGEGLGFASVDKFESFVKKMTGMDANQIRGQHLEQRKNIAG